MVQGKIGGRKNIRSIAGSCCLIFCVVKKVPLPDNFFSHRADINIYMLIHSSGFPFFVFFSFSFFAFTLNEGYFFPLGTDILAIVEKCKRREQEQTT